MESRDSRRAQWQSASQLVLRRAAWTAQTLEGKGFPHWADPDTGQWTTTPDGDWTGGAFPGLLWLGYRLTAQAQWRDRAHAWGMRLQPRVHRRTAFKGFGFFCGAALGGIVANDEVLTAMAKEAAGSLMEQFDPALGLIPLGPQAEEAGDTGSAFSSIDSLQASPLLFWAAAAAGDARLHDCARQHTRRVFDIHCRADGSIIQSSELDAHSGAVRRQFTHKGFSDTSIWGRAQAWGMLYTAMAYVRDRDAQWLADSMRAADWWLAHVPADGVAYWDFDDPAIPNAPRDTAATTIACAALLRLAEHAPEAADRQRYRQGALQAIDTLLARCLIGMTPESKDVDGPTAGMLVGGCFNNRPDSRAQDRVTFAELIFGSYFLLECLAILLGSLRTDEL